MTIFRHSARCLVSREDILKYKPLKQGIDILWEPTRTNSSVFIVTISGSSIDGIEKSDIDEELSRLNVMGDRIRTPKELKKIPKKAVTKQSNLNDPIFKENKDYEDLLSKLKSKPVASGDGGKKNNKESVAIIDEG